MPRHVVLIGDSIFDNAAYIDGGPDVAAQLRDVLDPDDRVTLLAVDGSVCEQVETQLVSCPEDATHIVLSSGGNDILHHAAMLDQKTDTVAVALSLLASARAEFEPVHRSMVETAASRGLSLAVCTIYDANMGPLITTAMSIFNDAITRNIHRAGADMIDLRLVCNERSDYANPIEPSVPGGQKIASAIGRFVNEIDTSSPNTRVFF